MDSDPTAISPGNPPEHPRSFVHRSQTRASPEPIQICAIFGSPFVHIIAIDIGPSLETTVYGLRDSLGRPDWVPVVFCLGLIRETTFENPAIRRDGPKIGSDQSSPQASIDHRGYRGHISRLKVSVFIAEGRIAAVASKRFKAKNRRISLMLRTALVTNHPTEFCDPIQWDFWRKAPLVVVGVARRNIRSLRGFSHLGPELLQPRTVSQKFYDKVRSHRAQITFKDIRKTIGNGRHRANCDMAVVRK